jgi:hypothetical protein
MPRNINLKELEQEAWKSVFQDGLWDIYLGLLLLAMAISALLSDIGVPKAWHNAIYVTLLVLPAWVQWAGKKFITVPRMGLVKFGPQRKAKLKTAVAIIYISLFLLVIVGILVATESIPPGRAIGIPIPTVVWTVMCIVGFSLAAYFLDFGRLYAYGLLYAIPFFVRIMLEQNPGLRGISLIAYFVSAGILLLMGTIVFVRFLGNNPVVSEEASYGNN